MHINYLLLMQKYIYLLINRVYIMILILYKLAQYVIYLLLNPL